MRLRCLRNAYIVLRFCVDLQYIPMSVLYGVFLFMGVSSVKGLQVTYITLS